MRDEGDPEGAELRVQIAQLRERLEDRDKRIAELESAHHHVLHQLADALEPLPMGIFLFGPDGRAILSNAVSRRFLRRAIPSRDDVGRNHWVAVDAGGMPIPPDQWPGARALRGERVDPGMEFFFEDEEGEHHWILVSAVPCRIPWSDSMGGIAILEEITAQKRAEEALRQRTESLEALLATLPMGVMIAEDPECLQVTGNPMAESLLRTRDNLSHRRDVPLPFKFLCNGRELPPHLLPLCRAARGEAVQEQELQLVFEDGTVTDVLLSAQTLFSASSAPRGAVATILDISSLKQAERALQEAGRRKDVFLAVLAHELRNPLAPLQAGLDLLRLPQVTTEVLQRAGDMMQRQLEHLVRLVDDLLDVARIGRGDIQLQREVVDLKEVCTTAVDACRKLLEERRHAFAFDAGDVKLAVNGDFHRLTQVISNLISNAAHYTDPGGRISLAIRMDRGAALIVVRDNGRGIAKQQLNEVFKMFNRGSEQGKGGGKGLGLGLAISRRIVAMHEGSIEAHSAGPGCGSEFLVRLPLAAGPELRDCPPPEVAVANEPWRVLVVDDNVDAAQALGVLLELQSHTVALCYDGTSAIAAAASFQPDVVLLDIGLPDLSGHEVARRIREAPGGQERVLIAVSGWGQAADKARAREAGFDQHVTKPLRQEILEPLVRSIRENRCRRSLPN